MHLPFFTIHAFQSTLSMRRATCGESAVSPHLGISIHALHEESDYQLSAMLPELT